MRLAQAMIFATIALAPCGPAAAGDAVFDAGVEGAAGFADFPLWSGVLQRVRADGDDKAMARAPRPRRAHPVASGGALPPASCTNACARALWRDFLASIRTLPPQRQLEAVNRWANAKPYIEDWVNWGVPDYWETPAEFVRRGGDCEDYALAKYFSLIRLGYPPGDLRIAVVVDRNLKASHAVLAVRLDGTTWLMDFAVPEVVPMAAAIQYAPVYAFNEEGWWLYDPVRRAGLTPRP